MNRRRFIWQEAETQSGLPEGYTAVDYLQSSGTQWMQRGDVIRVRLLFEGSRALTPRRLRLRSSGGGAVAETFDLD